MSKNHETFAALIAEARKAGLAAGNAHNPTPMQVVEYGRHGMKEYAPIPEGVCGFAWVSIRPARGAFANWLRATGLARLAHGGGLQIWVSGFGQSMERKEAYAKAFAEVLKAAGYNAYSDSRMD